MLPVKKTYLTFEYALILFYFIQAVLPDSFNWRFQISGFLILLINKHFFEGHRLGSVLLIPIQFILLISKPMIVDLLVVSLALIVMSYFPIYQHPDPSGPYKVGYKKLEFPGITYVGVYYPTDETTVDVKYTPSHNSWERFADLIKLFADYEKKKTVPKIVFKIATSFMENLTIGVNKDAKIIALEKTSNGFPVIVFSHGLSANIHIYSTILKEWASNGFIVFSVDHEEEVYPNLTGLKTFQDYLVVRSQQLGDRKKTVSTVIDYIYKTDNVNSLFESEVKLDQSKFFVSGHSFGGATAAEVAVEDKRITAGVMLLDPWFEPANQDVLTTPSNLPILSLRSTAFDRKKSIKELFTKHIDANKKNGMTISGFFKGSVHNSASDIPSLIPGELHLSTGFRKKYDIESQIVSHSLMTMAFLKTVNGKEENAKGNLRETVLEKFRYDLKKTGVKDLLLLDE